VKYPESDKNLALSLPFIGWTWGKRMCTVDARVATMRGDVGCLGAARKRCFVIESLRGIKIILRIER
jgi:hypothetical protein